MIIHAGVKNNWRKANRNRIFIGISNPFYFGVGVAVDGDGTMMISPACRAVPKARQLDEMISTSLVLNITPNLNNVSPGFNVYRIQFCG